MDQQTLPATDEIDVKLTRVELARDVANALFDIRWTCDDGGLFDETKYPPARLRPLRSEGLIASRPDLPGGFLAELTERGRLATVSVR